MAFPLIGASFAPWGGVGFGWREHSILIDNHAWARTWNTRGYVHPYAAPFHPPGPGPRIEEDTNTAKSDVKNIIN